MKFVQNFNQIFAQSKYDTIACDIYGVIHDGIKAYPFSKSTLENLKKNNEHVILLSNSTRLQDKLDAHMKNKFDIDTNAYEEILSSGTLTKHYLKDIATYSETGRLDKPSCHATAQHNGQSTFMEPQEFAKTYLKTGKFFLAGDPDWQEPLYLPLAPTLTRVMDYSDIDFVLLGSIRGLYPEKKAIDPFSEQDVRQDYQPLLDKCLERNVPIICANPDVFAPNGVYDDGSTKLLICPGYVGKMYEEMGGRVLYFGKPFKSIYDYLIENKSRRSIKEGESKASSRVLCVGDNLSTDISGASEAGLDNVLILGGVHWEELKDAKDNDELKVKIQQLCQEFNSPEPTYVMSLLCYE
jgi:HAD superfamily hydrolase (TIGR01450 family)